MIRSQAEALFKVCLKKIRRISIQKFIMFPINKLNNDSNTLHLQIANCAVTSIQFSITLSHFAIPNPCALTDVITDCIMFDIIKVNR